MPFIINISDRRQGCMQNSKCLPTLQPSETWRKLSEAEWCEPVPPKEFHRRNPAVLWILLLWAWSPVSPRGTWLSWWRWERSEGFCLVAQLGLSRYWSTFSGRRLSSRFASQLEPTVDGEYFLKFKERRRIAGLNYHQDAMDRVCCSIGVMRGEHWPKWKEAVEKNAGETDKQ